MKHWMVLTLLISQELHEAISNFLTEQGATGMEEVDAGSQGIKLKTYFPKDGKEKRRLHALHRYLKSLGNLFPEKFHYQIETAFIPEQDWGEKWKGFFKPIQIASRFIVAPPWERIQLKKDQIPIEISPGMAFGTGTHATTQLCIQAIESRLRKKGLSVLDVGTGSGILAIAAAKLGAQEVWGIDIDQVAIENARENVKRNGVIGRVKMRRGGIGSVLRKFDVVVANIDFKGLKKLKIPLLHRLRLQGFLILSGILREEKERIRQYYIETRALRFTKASSQGDWVCLTFKRVR